MKHLTNKIMKNIHILPTDKPSRLHFTEFFEELVFTPKYEKLDGVNIYITSYEEEPYPYALHIKKQEVLKINGIGENSKELFHDKGFNYQYECKKIILTTDIDLIKDGVQSIDDEFLEWFVKNPSCEEVEVEGHIYKGQDETEYKIIIPKEESKQRLEKYSERFDNKDNEIVEGIFNPETWGKRLVNDVPKQETLEEVAEKYVNSFEFGIAHPRRVCKNAFINGAKWQQEQQDEFAIGFAEWCLTIRFEPIENPSVKKLLEIYKNK